MKRFRAGELACVTAGVLLTFMSSFGQNFFVAVFGGELRKSFDLSNGQFGALYMCVTIVSAAVFVWAGRLVDHYPLRLVAVSTVLGLMAASLLLGSSNGPLTLALALFGLRLFGQGMSPHISATAVARWVDSRSRGRALAVAMIGNPIGEATLPLLAVAAMAEVGWRNIWFAVAVTLAVIFLPALLAFSRSMRRVSATAVDRSPVRPGHNRTNAEARPSRTAAQMIRDPLFYLLLPGLVTPIFINTSVFFHQVALCQAKGWSPAWFVASYPFSSAMNICSTLLAGWLLDRVGTRPVLAVLLLPQLLALLALATSDRAMIIPLYLALAGATMGTVQPVQSTVLAEIYGTGHFGEVRAVVTSSNVLMGALGPALIGLLIDRGVTFEQASFGMALYTLMAISLLFVAIVMMKRAVSNVALAGLTVDSTSHRVG